MCHIFWQCVSHLKASLLSRFGRGGEAICSDPRDKEFDLYHSLNFHADPSLFGIVLDIGRNVFQPFAGFVAINGQIYDRRFSVVRSIQVEFLAVKCRPFTLAN